MYLSSFINDRVAVVADDAVASLMMPLHHVMIIDD